MNNLLNYFIEANLYLICFYLIYQFLLSRDKHFRFNRAFLLTGILFSLVLPLVSINVKATGVGTEAYMMLPVITITAVQTESVNWLQEWWYIIMVAYSAGFVLSAIRLIWQTVHIFRYLPLLNSSRQKFDGYTIISTKGEIPTCSFFKFLFWDASVDLTDKEKAQILEHELAHIRQWHSIDILFIEILRVIFWFNPAIHFLKTGIAEVHEYLADKEAMKGVGADQYSRLLSLQVFKSFDFALSNNFHKSQVLKRIYMLKASRGKSLWLNIAFLLPLVSVLIALMAFRVDSTDILSVQNSNQTSLASTISMDTVKNQSDEIYMEVDVAPEPSSGMTAFFEYIATNLKYPADAREAGIEGKVFVQFVVDTDGKVTNVQSVKGIGYGCDEEAVRVMTECPAWKPGQKDGKVVKVRIVLPITYKLG
jgi:TonB family protein